MKRIEAYFSGRVQGVGFRYTVQSIARGFAVAGYVKNLRDGRVELVAEGEPEDLERFLGEIRDEMGSYIREVEKSEKEATGELEGFGIRY